MGIFIISICFTNIEKKDHMNIFFILIITIIIQINEKNVKNKYKTLLNFEKNKIQIVQMILNQFDRGKN